MRSKSFSILGWVLFFALPARAQEKPQVEILRSVGAVDPASDTSPSNPQWERVRLQLQVENRLPEDVTDLEIEVSLVSSKNAEGEDVESPIPGWRFDYAHNSPIAGSEESFISIQRTLPPRRSSPPADQIAYRANLRSYRVVAPHLDLAIQLLHSSALADQRAAFRTYEVSDGTSLKEEVRLEIRSALLRKHQNPTASDALRLLFAIRIAGEMRDASMVPALLDVLEKFESTAWGPALADLARRVVSDSQPDEPRLMILPVWARDATKLLQVRPEDALRDMVRDALLRIGDSAVPDLVFAQEKAASLAVRSFSASLLHAIGRTTVRSQLSIEDRQAQLRLIEIFGSFGAKAPVAVLAEIVTGSNLAMRAKAIEALKQIGPPAVRPLVNALGTPNPSAREALLSALTTIGPRGRSELLAAAKHYGIELSPSMDYSAALKALSGRLFEAARARWTNEIHHGLELVEQNRYEEGFRVLDVAYQAAPDLYMSFAERIARAYLKRAHGLYERGNYNAARDVVETGQSVFRLKEAEELLLQSELALVRGLLEIDELARAEEILNGIESRGLQAEIREMKSKLLAIRAKDALSRRDYGLARTLLDKARSLDPKSAELVALHRRLMLFENLAIVVVMSLMIPAALFCVVLIVRKRFDAKKMQRLTHALDRQVSDHGRRL